MQFLNPHFASYYYDLAKKVITNVTLIIILLWKSKCIFKPLKCVKVLDTKEDSSVHKQSNQIKIWESFMCKFGTGKLFLALTISCNASPTTWGSKIELCMLEWNMLASGATPYSYLHCSLYGGLSNLKNIIFVDFYCLLVLSTIEQLF